MQGSGYIVEIDLKVKIDEFEGPIDLLLSLILKNKLDITRISLAKIVDQFMEYSKLNKPDLKTYAEFLRVGSILLYLKAMAISNSSLNIDEEMEIETQNLINQLEILNLFRDLRNKLKQMHQRRGRFLSKSIKRSMRDHRQYSLDDVVKYAVKYFINIRRDLRFSLKRSEINVNEKIEEIKRLLMLKPVFTFSEFVASKSTIHVVASFIAILETTRSELTRLHQNKNFDEINIMKNIRS
ncbi:MAG: segregation and condensation protein A [Brevinematia bacterium]